MLKTISLFTLLLLCGGAYAAQATSPPTLADARALVEHGRTGDAIALLQQLVNRHPDLFQAWFLLGVTEARSRRFHDAIASFHRVIELQPRLAEPHNNLAVIYNELGDFRAAVKELEASLKLKPDYATAQENIGDLYVKLAADAYRKALRRDANPGLRRRYERLLHIRDVQADRGMPVEQAIATAPASTALKRSNPPAVTSHVQQKPPAKMQRHAAEKNDDQKDAVQKVDVPAADATRQTTVTGQAENATGAQGDPVRAAMAAVEAWRLAWNSQNLKAYFAAYGADFDYGARFESLAQWKNYKRWAISKRKFIRVTLENIESKQLAGGDIRFIFLQHFRSESYRSDDIKQLLLRKTENGWKIIREISQ